MNIQLAVGCMSGVLTTQGAALQIVHELLSFDGSPEDLEGLCSEVWGLEFFKKQFHGNNHLGSWCEDGKPTEAMLQNYLQASISACGVPCFPVRIKKGATEVVVLQSKHAYIPPPADSQSHCQQVVVEAVQHLFRDQDAVRSSLRQACEVCKLHHCPLCPLSGRRVACNFAGCTLCV